MFRRTGNKRKTYYVGPTNKPKHIKVVKKDLTEISKYTFLNGSEIAIEILTTKLLQDIFEL